MLKEYSYKGAIDEFEHFSDTLYAVIAHAPGTQCVINSMPYRHEFIPPNRKWTTARVGVSVRITDEQLALDSNVERDHSTASFELTASDSSYSKTVNLHTGDRRDAGYMILPKDEFDGMFEDYEFYAEITVESHPLPDSWTTDRVEKHKARTREDFESSGIDYP